MSLYKYKHDYVVGILKHHMGAIKAELANFMNIVFVMSLTSDMGGAITLYNYMETAAPEIRKKYYQILQRNAATQFLLNYNPDFHRNLETTTPMKIYVIDQSNIFNADLGDVLVVLSHHTLQIRSYLEGTKIVTRDISSSWTANIEGAKKMYNYIAERILVDDYVAAALFIAALNEEKLDWLAKKLKCYEFMSNPENLSVTNKPMPRLYIQARSKLHRRSQLDP